MVIKRVLLQNLLFYTLILFLAFMNHLYDNNISVLSVFFIPMFYLIFLSTQLNHTRHDSFMIKLIHHLVFIAKFIMIFVLIFLFQNYETVRISFVYFTSIIVLTIIEFLLLKGKTQVFDVKDVIDYSLKEVVEDPEGTKDKRKMIRDANKFIVFNSFLLGTIHSLWVPELECKAIVFTILKFTLAVYLYILLIRSNKKTYNRILAFNIMKKEDLDKKYRIANFLMYLSFIVTVGVRYLDGPNTITFLIIVPILMNYSMIQLNRNFVRGLMSDEEKKLMNID